MSDERFMTYERLADHAAKGASDYLFSAIETIERQMGKGAAEKYPAIVAALVQASSTEYLASMISHRVAPALTDIADSVRLVSDSVGNLSNE